MFQLCNLVSQYSSSILFSHQYGLIITRLKVKEISWLSNICFPSFLNCHCTKSFDSSLHLSCIGFGVMSWTYNQPCNLCGVFSNFLPLIGANCIPTRYLNAKLMWCLLVFFSFHFACPTFWYLWPSSLIIVLGQSIWIAVTFLLYVQEMLMSYLIVASRNIHTNILKFTLQHVLQ